MGSSNEVNLAVDTRKCNGFMDKYRTAPRSVVYRSALIIVILSAALAMLASHPAIPQDLEYHNFADTRILWGIPNTNDVLSNLLFIFTGMFRLWKLPEYMKNRSFWRIFYYSIILVGFGSGYYHLAPENATLIWDRIPMTLGFASLISLIFIERISERAGKCLLVPLLLSGVGSVIYWYMTEISGAGDLRPYVAMQFLPILLLPMLLLLFPNKESGINKSLWFLFIGYVIAKICEMEDAAIYKMTSHIISGHTLKHVSAAIGILFFNPMNNKKCKYY